MRLYHVSEDPNIAIFHPRPPKNEDLDPSVGLVWAVEEESLPFLLTPRDCPRVSYRPGAKTIRQDREQYFSSSGSAFVLIIEQGWLEKLQNTTLYLYEFDPADFALQYEVAGYYAAKTAQTPIACHVITDIMGELFRRNVEVRVVDNLWEMADRVQNSTVEWVLSRMRLALPRKSTKVELAFTSYFGHDMIK